MPKGLYTWLLYIQYQIVIYTAVVFHTKRFIFTEKMLFTRQSTCFLESKSTSVSELSLYSLARGAFFFFCAVICISYHKINCDCFDVVQFEHGTMRKQTVHGLN